MRYDYTQPAAFVADRELVLPLQTLSFPTSWRRPILDLFTAGWSEEWRARAKQVPLQRLNALLRAAAPDLVSTATRAQLGEEHPWLFASAAFPEPVLATFINAWLHDLPKSEEGKALVLPTIDRLNSAGTLQWEPRSISLTERTLSAGGTPVPERHLFSLLPDYAASLIAGSAYEHHNGSVQFHQTALNPANGYAELISWPPLQHHTGRGVNQTTWYYSATIKIGLRTTPFDPAMRLHVHTGIRRWTLGEVRTRGRYGASTYMLSSNPFVAGAPIPQRFAVAQLLWNKQSKDMGWKQGGVGQILPRVGALEYLPAPDQLAHKSEAWIYGRDGVTAAVTYHTTMKGRSHPVGPGLMPAERSRLTSWIGRCLEPSFRLDEPLVRVMPAGKGIQSFTKLKSVPKTKASMTDSEIEEVTSRQADVRAMNATIAQGNARMRRQQLAEAVGGTLGVVLLFQGEGDGMQSRLLGTVQRLLDLPARTASGRGSWTWSVDGFTLNVHSRPLGQLGGPLGDGTTPQKGKKHDEQIKIRRGVVASTVAQIAEEAGDTPQLVLVELDGRDDFDKRTTDPKFAVRIGCADAGMVSQFVQPDKVDEEDPKAADENNNLRAEAAWLDGFRQLGERFIPRHRLGDEVPESLHQLAFWVVKRRNDDTNSHQVFAPIAVLIKPDEKCVMGKTSDMDEWVPYPELLKRLAGAHFHAARANEDQQKEQLAAFIRRTLTSLRSTETLVVTETHNIRYRLPTMLNSDMIPDRLQLAGLKPQRITAFGKKLRLVRVGGNDRLETPQAWAYADERIGISDGLWQRASGGEADDGSRVFYSTVDKPGTHNKVRVDHSKLTPHYQEKAESGVDGAESEARNHLDPSKNAWNAELLEIVVVAKPDAEKASTWATFLHQQRHCSDDYRESLGRPLILHLARLTNQYALPADDTIEDDGEEDEEESDPEVQLELDI
ncbi:DUF3962 domain-containing protein [Kineosporia sp. NBRC 101731]|uniref:pPIWI_RE module domain-containing protein n=1 Tax=Kineosporia sp. NBRC 101731 TaxID=3032199 RepID=UPI0024A424A6|nr:DUF3962 domain-containing protein [Kineosporia sp. NBRC 101731]GLY30456.1 hypothetical protein Kisp02_38210 [Kineosporia sp. NBRC 101731]